MRPIRTNLSNATTIQSPSGVKFNGKSKLKVYSCEKVRRKQVQFSPQIQQKTLQKINKSGISLSKNHKNFLDRMFEGIDSKILCKNRNVFKSNKESTTDGENSIKQRKMLTIGPIQNIIKRELQKNNGNTLKARRQSVYFKTYCDAGNQIVSLNNRKLFEVNNKQLAISNALQVQSVDIDDQIDYNRSVF